MSDPRYWIWLNLCFAPGSVHLDALLLHYANNPKAIYRASPDELYAVCKDQNAVNALLKTKNFEAVNRVFDYCEQENVGILTPDCRHYPSSLMRITGKPPVIYYKGRLPDFEKRLTASIVGTRNVTDYGKNSAYTIAHDLARAGTIVVSGLALGTDTSAHRGTLDAGGHTVAFLGCGIDVIYPKENLPLMREIASRGTIMTEFPPGTRPDGWHFPVRNRLISGISSAVLVVEAAAKSGALITASHALKQGKLLYAVPGKVGELSSVGTNMLIRNGAKMVTCANDILVDFKALFKEHSNFTENFKNTAFYAQPINENSYFNNNFDNKNKFNAQNNTQNNGLNYFANPYNPNQFNIKNGTPAFNQSANDSPNVNANGFASTNQKPAFQSQAAQPRPVITYTSSEEDDARGYMSFSNDEPRTINNGIYGDFQPVTIKYPSEKVPEGGYKIQLDEEKIKAFREMEESAQKRRFAKDEIFKTSAKVEHINSLNELRKQIDIERAKSHPEKQKSESQKPVSENHPQKISKPDTAGLSDDEAKVINYLFEKGKTNSETIANALKIQIGPFMSIVTILEIKHKITQFPGGYIDLVR